MVGRTPLAPRAVFAPGNDRSRSEQNTFRGCGRRGRRSRCLPDRPGRAARLSARAARSERSPRPERRRATCRWSSGRPRGLAGSRPHRSPRRRAVGPVLPLPGGANRGPNRGPVDRPKLFVPGCGRTRPGCDDRQSDGKPGKRSRGGKVILLRNVARIGALANIKHGPEVDDDYDDIDCVNDFRDLQFDR